MEGCTRFNFAGAFIRTRGFHRESPRLPPPATSLIKAAFDRRAVSTPDPVVASGFVVSGITNRSIGHRGWGMVIQPE